MGLMPPNSLIGPISLFFPEERHRSAILKLVLHIVVCGTEHLYTQLVHRVIEAAADTHRPPCIASFHQPCQPLLLGLSLVSLLLRLILQLEQQPLLL